MIKLMAQIIDLERAIEMLVPSIAPESEMLTHFLHVIQDNLKKLSSLVVDIENDAVLMWIFEHDDLGLKTTFTPIKGYLDLIDMGLVGALTPAQKARTHHALHYMNQIIETFSAIHSQGHEFYSSESAASPVMLPARQALSHLWSILRYYLHPLNIPTVPNLPAIVYHRWHTPALFEEITRILAREPFVTGEPSAFRFDVDPTEDGLLIKIRAQGVLMLPWLWDQIRHRFSEDRLCDFGGRVEPLAWDKGYGQGVIIRLPWAKPLGSRL